MNRCLTGLLTITVVHQVLWEVCIFIAHCFRSLRQYLCYRITKIDFNADAKSAVVHFEKASAAKTALMVRGEVNVILYI
jgi:hypothetical protein